MMTNYKKLKNGFSMAELLVALSIFALISTMGLSAFAFMIKTQYTNRSKLEDELLREVRISNCIKKVQYEQKKCSTSSDPNCLNITSSYCQPKDFN
jgi:prepilin-type N-terminal cleavage/methylation domain-containing protein